VVAVRGKAGTLEHDAETKGHHTLKDFSANHPHAMTTILIVEDEKQVRVFAASYLRQQGYRTISAETPDEALALVESVGDVDVLFSEIKIKNDTLAGVRLAQQAVRRRPGLKVLYASEHEMSERLKPLLGEFSIVLEKPYTVAQLKRGLSAQLGRPVIASEAKQSRTPTHRL
jgi:CheY-like chemotaxis protein